MFSKSPQSPLSQLKLKAADFDIEKITFTEAFCFVIQQNRCLHGILTVCELFVGETVQHVLVVVVLVVLWRVLGRRVAAVVVVLVLTAVGEKFAAQCRLADAQLADDHHAVALHVDEEVVVCLLLVMRRQQKKS